MKRKHIPGIILLFFLAAASSSFLISFKAAPISILKIENKRTASGNNYTIFHKNDMKLDVTLKRPLKSDKSIHLCIAGPFTDLVSLTVDGLFIDNGIVHNRNKINRSLGGGIKIINGECEIFPTQKGKLLNDSLIKSITAGKGSFFQQIQLIEKGKGAKFKDVKEFQRRAIVKLKQNKTAVIESYEHITLAAFTKDLLELGVLDAIYTDMGSWDEGWYRKGSSVETIGRLRTQTARQCNWVILKN
ncbi:MAG TPA: hypothetical protein VF868_13190 [Bacteroidia bacterium]|jgi:hypothetical protein